MLSRILTYKIPKKKGYWYTKHPNSSDDISDGSWELFNMDTPEKIKYKGTKGSAQITSTQELISLVYDKSMPTNLNTSIKKNRL